MFTAGAIHRPGPWRQVLKTSIFLRTACAALAACAAFPAFAQVKEGVDAWSRGDYPAAVQAWKVPAANGDADAQFNLAQAYKLGRGVPQDLMRAEKLFEQAAANGHLQAADNYGLLLFQRGERAKAMPYIEAASGRGDPRAHYVLGLAHFNGDGVAKDWERAYALVSLAQQAGLPQANGALSQMDKFIPLEERQRSVSLAAEIAEKAEATRQRQIAAADLGVTGPGSQASVKGSLKPFDVAASAEQPGQQSPAAAGADYTRGGVPPIATIMRETRPPARPSPPPPAVAPAPAPVAASPVRSAPAVAATSGWRVQLGAFGVPGNADRLWNRVKDRPELAGHGRLSVPAGRIVKLQAGGFADRASAQAACNRLKSAGFDCIVARN